MTKPLIVLADPDTDYIILLESKFLEELRSGIDLEVITSNEYAEEFFSTPHDIEILFVAENFYTEDLHKQNTKHLFVLTESQNTSGTTRLDADFTFKYTNLNFLFNKAISASDCLKPQLASAQSTEVFLFYSPIGGSGSTTCAAAFAAFLQETYKRVLFVEAEYISSFGYLINNVVSASSEMISEMGRANGYKYEQMSRFIASDCFDYLPPLQQNLLYFGIDFSYYSEFIKSAKESGKYDYIVVSTDSVFNTDKNALFALADKVVITVNQDKYSYYKTCKFMDNLGAASADKCLFICNKFIKDAPNAFKDANLSTKIVLDGYVEFEQTCQNANIFDLLNLHSFGYLVGFIC